jgi:hypothetical protein
VDTLANPELFHYGDSVRFDGTSLQKTVTMSGACARRR